MRGVPADDPSCIHNINELEQRVEEIGFLPLFAGDVPGFSVEEHTVPEDWWTGNPEKDPWEWRALAARRGRENSSAVGQDLFPEHGCQFLPITGEMAMTSMRAGTMNWRAVGRRRSWICSWGRMQTMSSSPIR